jgi:hypothetical protein
MEEGCARNCPGDCLARCWWMIGAGPVPDDCRLGVGWTVWSGFEVGRRPALVRSGSPPGLSARCLARQWSGGLAQACLFAVGSLLVGDRLGTIHRGERGSGPIRSSVVRVAAGVLAAGVLPPDSLPACKVCLLVWPDHCAVVLLRRAVSRHRRRGWSKLTRIATRGLCLLRLGGDRWDAFSRAAAPLLRTGEW